MLMRVVGPPTESAPIKQRLRKHLIQLILFVLFKKSSLTSTRHKVRDILRFENIDEAVLTGIVAGDWRIL
uniref:HTH_48 domain-containing protein n=1 Tax=Steinernema glaseri TaxID=37863 RepID=A0A1I7YT94_9BILA